jgi:hypothetical protein
MRKQLIQSKGFRSFIKGYVNFWLMGNWISIIAGYIILALWIVEFRMTSQLTDEYADLQPRQDSCGGSTQEILTCNDELGLFLTSIRELGEFLREYRTFLAFYPLLIVFRLFESFSAQPRLAVVTDTLFVAASDLFHFSIVFMAVFMSFAVMGTALFGRELSAFVTVGRTSETLFRMLMGDFDLGDMRVVGRELSFAYFAMFMMLTLLILMNMLIAVLMDVYSGVKGNTLGSATLIHQATEIMRRFHENRQGIRISLKVVENCLRDRYGDRYFEIEECITVPIFLDIVPGLGRTQATRMLVRTCDKQVTTEAFDGGLSAVVRMVTQLTKQNATVLRQLETVHDRSVKMQRDLNFALGHENKMLPANGDSETPDRAADL